MALSFADPSSAPKPSHEGAITIRLEKGGGEVYSRLWSLDGIGRREGLLGFDDSSIASARFSTQRAVADLRPIRPHPNHRGRAEAILLEPDTEVHAIDPRTRILQLTA